MRCPGANPSDEDIKRLVGSKIVIDNAFFTLDYVPF
jgi:hypothetical protein